MSKVLPTPEGRTLGLASSQLSKPQRVLACVLCQQRKVKCDRKYPCANCIKSRAQCVPATQVSRRRRRKFPERELIERLRKYEDMLRQHNIKFEPFHKDSVGEKESPNVEGGYDSNDEQPKTAGAGWPSPSTTVNSERVYEAKSIWHTINQQLGDPDFNCDFSDDDDGGGGDDDDYDDGDDGGGGDDVSEAVVKKAWDQMFENNDLLLFGWRKTAVKISTLQPEPVQIFKLWQLYLENVSPLLMVTHTPSLQGRIIDAASDILNIGSTLEALMFSIYCTSISSLAEGDCQALFGSPKADLLARYQFGCQQALLNCRFLRCGDRDCLTAFYLYLVSARPNTVPQSLSAMLGVAIRIAQRIGIHSESALAKCTALEAEMRRRLWWSLTLFDARVGELADFKATTLTPTWDCRVPLNVNDSDFRPEMKEPPQVQGPCTEALFVVVRSELGDFVRHTMFHLDFTIPALKPVAKDVRHSPIPDGSELVHLEQMIEDKYLKFCDPENPLHFMTIWMTRAYLARCRLMEHYSRYSGLSVHQEAQHDAVISYALRMLECDTKIVSSPLTKGFLWLVHFYFPFPAYLQIAQNLKHRPVSDQAEQAWEVMSDNHAARFSIAWEARKVAFKQLGKSLITPRIVLSIKQQMAQIARNAQNLDTPPPNSAINMGINDFPTSMSISMGFGSHGLLYGIRGQEDSPANGSGPFPEMLGPAPLDINVNQLDWSVMDWDLVNCPDR